jgi:hypothetical protein
LENNGLIKSITAFFKERPDLCIAVTASLLAFSLRYWFFWRYPYPLMLHEQDGIAYMSIAKELLAFKVPGNLFMPPFYPVVIALFSFLPVNFEIAARIASITMDALVVLPLFGLSRIVLPRMAALAVCVLWATFTFSLYFTPSPLSQSTYICMLFSGIYILYRALYSEGRLWLFAAAGACFCAAYLTRPEGVTALGAALILIAAGALRNGVDRRYHLKGGIILLAAFALCALPYVLMLHSALGHWTFTGKTTVAIKGIDGSLTIGKNAGKAKGGMDLWLETFGGVTGGIRFIKANISGFFALLLGSFPKAMHVCALIGVPLVFIGRNFYSRLFLLLPLVVTFPVYVANLPKTHSYIYPLFPLYMILFVAGIWGATTFCRSGVEKLLPAVPENFLKAITLAMLLIPSTIVGLNGVKEATATFTSPDLLFQVEQTNKLFKAAGADVKEASDPNDLVMTRWGLISYFAERPLMVMPKGSIDEVLAAGRKSRARFMVIDTESVLSRRQELTDLLAPLYGRAIDPRYGLSVVVIRQTDVGSYVLYRYL